jgi:hypothetical protein
MSRQLEDRLREAFAHRARATDVRQVTMPQYQGTAVRRRPQILVAAAIASMLVIATAAFLVARERHQSDPAAAVFAAAESFSVFPKGGRDEVERAAYADPERLVRDYLADRTTPSRFPVKEPFRAELAAPFPVQIGDVRRGERPLFYVDKSTRLVGVRLSTTNDGSDGEVIVRRLGGRDGGPWYVAGAFTTGFHGDDIVYDGRRVTGRVRPEIGKQTEIVAYDMSTGDELGSTIVDADHTDRFTLDATATGAIGLRFYNGGTFTDAEGHVAYASIAYAETIVSPDGRPHRLADFESLCGLCNQKRQGLHGGGP